MKHGEMICGTFKAKIQEKCVVADFKNEFRSNCLWETSSMNSRGVICTIMGSKSEYTGEVFQAQFMK